MPLLDYSFDMSKIDFSKKMNFDIKNIEVDVFGLGLADLRYALSPKRQKELYEKTKREMDDLNLGEVVGGYNVSDSAEKSTLLEISEYFSGINDEMLKELDFLNEKKKQKTGQPLTVEERIAWIKNKLDESKGISTGSSGVGGISNSLFTDTPSNNKRNIIIGVGVLVLTVAGYLIIKKKK